MYKATKDPGKTKKLHKKTNKATKIRYKNKISMDIEAIQWNTNPDKVLKIKEYSNLIDQEYFGVCLSKCVSN